MKIKDYEQLMAYVRSGDRLAFGNFVGKVERSTDPVSKYKCCGMALRFIVDNYKDIELIRYVSK